MMKDSTITYTNKTRSMSSVHSYPLKSQQTIHQPKASLVGPFSLSMAKMEETNTTRQAIHSEKQTITYPEEKRTQLGTGDWGEMTGDSELTTKRHLYSEQEVFKTVHENIISTY